MVYIYPEIYKVSIFELPTRQWKEFDRFDNLSCAIDCASSLSSSMQVRIIKESNREEIWNSLFDYNGQVNY